MEKQHAATSLRDRAVEKARARVQRDGFDTLRLSDVARDLGVTHAALYKYFTDKQDLIDAINVQWMDEINSELQAICNHDESATFRIQQWFLTLYEMRRDKVLKNAREYASYIRTEELRRPCAQQDALQRKEQLVGLVQAAMDTGQIRQGDSRSVAGLLLSATDHFIHPAFIASHVLEDKKNDFKQLLHVLIRGLA